MGIDTFGRAATITLIALAVHGVAHTSPLAPGQVSGAELQAWLDADGLAAGGINLQNSCSFMARSRGAERHLTIFCAADTAPWMVKGEAKVVGDRWCIKFSYPNGLVVDRCEEFFKIGDNKYELRYEGMPVTRLYRLVP